MHTHSFTDNSSTVIQAHLDACERSRQVLRPSARGARAISFGNMSWSRSRRIDGLVFALKGPQSALSFGFCDPYVTLLHAWPTQATITAYGTCPLSPLLVVSRPPRVNSGQSRELRLSMQTLLAEPLHRAQQQEQHTQSEPPGASTGRASGQLCAYPYLRACTVNEGVHNSE